MSVLRWLSRRQEALVMVPNARRWNPLVIAALAIGFWSQVFLWRSFLHQGEGPEVMVDATAPASITPAWPSPDWVPPPAIGCSGGWPPHAAPSSPRVWEIRQVVQVAAPPTNGD